MSVSLTNGNHQQTGKPENHPEIKSALPVEDCADAMRAATRAVFTDTDQPKASAEHQRKELAPDRQLATKDGKFSFPISASKQSELYKQLQALEEQGLSVTLAETGPGRAEIRVANALGAELGKAKLDVFELSGQKKPILGEEVQKQITSVLRDAGASKFAALPPALNAQLKSLRESGLHLVVDVDKAGHYSVENSLGTRIGGIHINGLDVDARSNLPRTAEDLKRLSEMIQGAIKLNEFVK